MTAFFDYDATLADVFPFGTFDSEPLSSFDSMPLSLDMLTPPNSPQAAEKKDDFSFDDISRTLERAVTPLPDVLTPPTSPQHSYSASSSLLSSDAGFLDVLNFLVDLDDDESPATSPVAPASPAPEAASRTRKRKSYATLFDEEEPAPLASVPASRAKRVRTNKAKPVAVVSSPASSPAAPVEVEAPKSARRAVDKEIISKRDSHNISERQRRKELKNSFELLRRAVPSLVDNPRVHTASILQNAIEFIAQLQQEEAELEAEKSALRAENARLSRALQVGPLK